MAQADAALGSTASAGMIDARPIRSTSTDTIWDHAVETRDRLAAAVKESLEREGMDALVLVSQNGNFPPWVRLEAWVPTRRSEPNARERASLELIVDAKPYHEHLLVHTARLTLGRRNIAVTARPEFSAENAQQWTRYALGRSGKPANYHPVVDALIALLLSFIPFVPKPYSNRVERRFRNLLPLSGAALLSVASVILLAFGIRSLAADFDDPWEFLEFVVVYPSEFAEAVTEYPELLFASTAVLSGFVGLIASIVISRRRKHLVEVPAQPTVAPRNLGLVDSWHTVVAGLGGDAVAVRQRIRERLTETDGMSLECRSETYSYRTPNGYEERERLVVAKGQSLVHVHVYPFGNDVFIGWHAYLNWAKWDETVPVCHRTGRGSRTEFRGLRPGFYVPSQFDLIDLSSLSDFVHRRIERELKRLMKEKRIDQEIDFQIIRGDRERALDSSRRSGDAIAERRSGIWNRIIGGAAAWQPRSETEIVRSAEPTDAGRRAYRAQGRSAAIVLPAITLAGIPVLVFLAAGTNGSANQSIGGIGPSFAGIFIGMLYATAIGFALRRFGRISITGAIVGTALVLAVWITIPFIISYLFSQKIGDPQLVAQIGPLLFAIAIFALTVVQVPKFGGLGFFFVFIVGWVGIGAAASAVLAKFLPELGPLDLSTRVLVYQVTGLVAHLPMLALYGSRLQRRAEGRQW